MTLDNERQREELVSLLKLVPIQGNLHQGVDQIIGNILNLIKTIEEAKIEKGE